MQESIHGRRVADGSNHTDARRSDGVVPTQLAAANDGQAMLTSVGLHELFLWSRASFRLAGDNLRTTLREAASGQLAAMPIRS